jgi:hypothetical protein
MKRNIFYLFFVVISFVSCDMKEDFKPENSNAVDFAGEWNYGIYSADLATSYKIYDRNKLLTYNTSANLANEIWVVTNAVPADLKLKFKSTFTGDVSSFSSTVQSDNVNFLTAPATAPGSVGATYQLVQYKTCAVQSGKIISKAAISKAGNPTDSIYLQVNAVQNTSAFVGVASGTDVIWQLQSTSDANVQFVIAGQRVTGFVEDIW